MAFSFRISGAGYPCKSVHKGKVFIFCLLIMLTTGGASGQEVEHNYPVGPSNTNCDSLRLEGLSSDEALEKITGTSFRFHQKFNYSRLSGVQAGQYFSCDGKSGFLLITVERKKSLYSQVPREIWNNLISSGDPDSFYQEKIMSVFPDLFEEEER